MPLTLASLDADVLAHIVRWADSPSSISRLDRTARLFETFVCWERCLPVCVCVCVCVSECVSTCDSVWVLNK